MTGRAQAPAGDSGTRVGGGSAAFPIDEIAAEVRASMMRPRPLVVAAPTGSGKSTRLPHWAWGATERKVLVVEPRRVACRALAQWVAAQMRTEVGAGVGYRVRYDDRSSSDTVVLFVTPGVAIGMMASGELDDFGTVIVDEFHERGLEVDFVVAAVRQRASAKLVVCSATIDTEHLAARLDADVVVSEGRAFPVTIAHEGDGAPTDRDLAERVRDVVARLLGSHPDGDVLVFLPGRGEIERCRRELSGLPAELVAVHGSLDPAELTRAFRASAKTRRVYLSTNVAETSVTLPGVRSVVDSGLARVRLHQGRHCPLTLTPIARASMDQRSGRAGRVASGHCVRLWGAAFEPESATPPEIERIELDDLLLRAAWCGLSTQAFARLPWITPPPAFALEQAVERLAGVGALDASGELTELGRRQAELPVSWTGARMLAGAPRTLLPWLVDVVALMEIGRSLLLDDRGSGAVAEARGELLDGAIDEVMVELRCARHGEPGRHGLHPAAWREARRMAANLRRRVGVPASEERPDVRAGWPPGLAEHLVARVPEAVFVRRRTADGRRGAGSDSDSAWGNGSCEVRLRDYRVPHVETELQPSPPRAGVLLEQRWLGRGQGARGVGRLLLRLEPSVLADAGLGTEHAAEVRVRHGAIEAHVERRYAGVVLASEVRAPRGPALCEAVAELVLSGRLRPSWKARLLDAHHAWCVVAAWAELESLGVIPSPPTDPRADLSAKLQRLGVERLEDLDLVEPSDIEPPIAEFTAGLGLSDKAMQSLCEDFPRTWEFPGGTCGCTLDAARRMVVLTPSGRGFKGDPPARYLPRFRGLAVEYVRASRRIRLR